jgi:hypothetical protein
LGLYLIQISRLRNSFDVKHKALIPESCMKINVKFEKYLITTGCECFGVQKKLNG